MISDTKLSEIKRFVAQNVTNLMDNRFPDEEYSNRTAKAIALAKKCGLGKNTVLRLLDPNDLTSLSIDNLEAISTALAVLPYQLLIPCLNVDNPQISCIPSKTERRKSWQMSQSFDEEQGIHINEEIKQNVGEDVLKLSVVVSMQKR